MNSIIFSLNKFSRANRQALSFLFVFFLIIILDFASNLILFKIVSYFKLSFLYKIDLSFAPEVWAAIIALIIGTLIIVIALASENTPELMDIFINEWINLIYVWFLILFYHFNFAHGGSACVYFERFVAVCSAAEDHIVRKI